ncbi:MAG: GUN4 domain-containing protein [Microcoleaceae cyanobacterium]
MTPPNQYSQSQVVSQAPPTEDSGQSTNSHSLTSAAPAEKSTGESDLEGRVEKLEHQLSQVVELLGDVYLYGQLRDYLAAGDIRAADEETTRVMLSIAGHSNQETVTPEDALKFPCSAIQVIDQLWLKYSDGRFGFSVQTRIYTEMGGNDDITRIDMDLVHRVGERLGCRSNDQSVAYDDLNFSFEAPEGCFPAGWWDSPYGAKMIIYFAARIMACDI